MALGALTLAVVAALGRLTPAVAEFLKTCGPPLVELVGKIRKQWAETTALAHANAAEIAEMKEQNRLLEERNALFRDALGRALNTIHGLEQNAAALGAAGLIDNGYLRGSSAAEGGKS